MELNDLIFSKVRPTDEINGTKRKFYKFVVWSVLLSSGSRLYPSRKINRSVIILNPILSSIKQQADFALVPKSEAYTLYRYLLFRSHL
ncbi:hypothetical protein VCHA38O209_10861 [Vibrio chagasii]|nr:hypothetical protein VCHA35P150_170087 [Vibrio chagasii]CAH6837856.1 hypothetical protein VCHA29O37_10005 [Vibrio chagasii]CAH6939017.1 hypothetical protein VCHA51O444_100004 [Vibrio chagasii]CAH7065101.1 hypothetical protein VCHA53O474_10004 [Vibrio chagasii]CAH7172439.1 hypothetical protein VCHA44O286_260005 [Vibrio chagasii]